MSLAQPSRQLVSQDDAALVQSAEIPRSKFINRWGRLMTFDAGYIVPFLVDEVYPGDHLRYDIVAYVRMSTPLFPLFSNQRIDTHIFFVPYRLLWDNFVRMMGEQDTVDASIDYTTPQIVSKSGGYDNHSIYDHMGLPTAEQITDGQTITHSALPLRAYNLIFNQWYRDQNIVEPAAVTKSNGPDNYLVYELRRRAKSHDYFTSALPWPQKFTAPSLPVAGLAPVQGLGGTDQVGAFSGPITVYETGPTVTSYALYKKLWDAGQSEVLAEMNGSTGLQIYADLSQATGVSINQLRQAWMIQSLLERDARGGTRYTETVRAHWGVVNPDFRLQRPEYIGGGSSQLAITPIAQTAPTAGATVGALGAAGTSSGQHHASYAATEHGVILGFISVKSELAYQQGMHRMWSRLTRFDYPYPELAGLGEQAILRKEIYATGTDANDDLVFGYQERFHELRSRYSEVTGYFKSNISGTLDMWHLAQWFATPPTLSQEFIEDTPPMERVLAAAEQAEFQQYLADINIHREATRALPMFGTPVQIGRF